MSLNNSVDQRYKWVLFDADDTLFHFDAFAGLQRVFARYGVDFGPQEFAEYQGVNQPLWLAYQNGQMTATVLQITRFESWAQRLSVSAQQLNAEFLAAMADICQPLPGVIELLVALKGRVRLGIITNGFTALQQIRLERTGLQAYFDFVVVSEEIGVAKPDVSIFHHAMALMAQPQKHTVLMVGDNLHSDILGGLNAGIHTCWYNVKDLAAPAHIQPHYTIRHHQQLHRILLD